jgi:hypothetical protein
MKFKLVKKKGKIDYLGNQNIFIYIIFINQNNILSLLPF